MATVNNGSLTDYTALASGGYLKYTYRVGKRFTLGAALYNTTHVGGMNLTQPDPVTGRISRYEAGLFDGLDLANGALEHPALDREVFPQPSNADERLRHDPARCRRASTGPCGVGRPG